MQGNFDIEVFCLRFRPDFGRFWAILHDFGHDSTNEVVLRSAGSFLGGKVAELSHRAQQSTNYSVTCNRV